MWPFFTYSTHIFRSGEKVFNKRPSRYFNLLSLLSILSRHLQHCLTLSSLIKRCRQSHHRYFTSTHYYLHLTIVRCVSRSLTTAHSIQFSSSSSLRYYYFSSRHSFKWRKKNQQHLVVDMAWLSCRPISVRDNRIIFISYCGIQFWTVKCGWSV